MLPRPPMMQITKDLARNSTSMTGEMENPTLTREPADAAIAAPSPKVIE